MPDKCLKCGRCCYQGTVVQGRLVKSRVPCKYLNTVTYLCESYLDRFWLKDVRCLTIPEAIWERSLPGDCPYVAGRADYKPPEEVQVEAGTD